MKITVIGGGSTYTPELVNGFISLSKSLPLKELWLMDIDPERLNIVGGFAQRMVKAKGQPFEIILSLKQQEAIAGASYVITQLRVGQMPARKGDEYLCKRHGLIGQETTGIGGMAKALRTIPMILSIAKDIGDLAPRALLLNFTNPAGLITEALSRYSAEINSVGVCNVGITTKMHLLELLKEILARDVREDQARLETLGLNHLTWHRGFSIEEEDVWPQLFDAFKKKNREEGEEWDSNTLESLGMIPNYYLQYFYYSEKKISAQESWPPSRAEEVMDIERDLLHQYSDPHLLEPPPDLMKRGGAYYSTLATQIINSHFHDLGEIHVVNIPNHGAVKEWPSDWVLELAASIRTKSITALPAKPLPLACFGLIAQVKAFELLTVEAAVHGNRNAAYQAMLCHPLGPSADKVTEVLDDLLMTNRVWLPQFNY